jgi:hypothetical protein
MLSHLKRAGVVALAVAAGGCGSRDGPPVEARSDCRAYANDVESRFRPLPRGLMYVPVPDEVKDPVRLQAAALSGPMKVRAVLSGSVPQAVVLIGVFKQPLRRDKEDGFLRSFASTMRRGATYEPADLPGGPATRFESTNRVAYVQIEDHCRFITVFGDYDRPVRRIAEAVLR